MIRRWMFLALLAVAAQVAPAQEMESLAPARNWRVLPEEVRASTQTMQLAPVLSGLSAQWELSTTASDWLAVRLPADAPEHVLLAWRTAPRDVRTLVEVHDPATAQWHIIEEKTSGRYMEKADLRALAGKWVRLRFEHDPARGPLTISHIGLYEVRPDRRDDYWLVIGASIQAQSIRQEIFHREVTERYPGYDPLIFNRAVSGWTTTNLLNNVSRFLEEHPEASYVLIHIGGNNVSRDRPYPGGVDQLREELEKILQIIQEDGRIPVLSRLSYRAYKREPLVPPEENGSGPYVENVFDPLIAKYCPRFYDATTGKGVVDAYGWFKEHQDELSTDGIHVNKLGAWSWNRLWAEHAGGVVYGGR